MTMSVYRCQRCGVELDLENAQISNEELEELKRKGELLCYGCDSELRVQVYLLEFYELGGIRATIKYIVRTSADLSKVREAYEKLKEEYNKLYTKFNDFNEVYEWLDKRVKELLPDAEPIDFIWVY